MKYFSDYFENEYTVVFIQYYVYMFCWLDALGVINMKAFS